MPDIDPERDATTTLGYASQNDVKRHPGPSDEALIRVFGWGMAVAILIPFVGGGIGIAILLLFG